MMLLTKQFKITISLKRNILISLIICLICFSIAAMLNYYNSSIVDYEARYDDACLGKKTCDITLNVKKLFK